MAAVGFPGWQQLAFSQNLHLRFSLENLRQNEPPCWPSDQHPWTGSFLSGSASPPPHSSATSCLCQLHLSHRPQWHTHRQTHTCCVMLLHSLVFFFLLVHAVISPGGFLGKPTIIHSGKFQHLWLCVCLYLLLLLLCVCSSVCLHLSPYTHLGFIHPKMFFPSTCMCVYSCGRHRL